MEAGSSAALAEALEKADVTDGLVPEPAERAEIEALPDVPRIPSLRS